MVTCRLLKTVLAYEGFRSAVPKVRFFEHSPVQCSRTVTPNPNPNPVRTEHSEWRATPCEVNGIWVL